MKGTLIKELILIETSQAQQVKKLLEQAHISYKVYQEPTGEKEQLKKQLIKDYQKVAKSQKRSREDKMWDKTSSDGLNE